MINVVNTSVDRTLDWINVKIGVAIYPTDISKQFINFCVHLRNFDLAVLRRPHDFIDQVVSLPLPPLDVDINLFRPDIGPHFDPLQPFLNLIHHRNQGPSAIEIALC